MIPPRQFSRRADWVWRPRGIHAVPFGTNGLSIEDEQNRYVYFRYAFVLEQPVLSARVYASTDGRYRLYVNGHFVGRGPARTHSGHQQVDPYDLTPYLHEGENVIAALAHSYGRLTAWYEPPQWEQVRAFGCGGFFLQGDLICEGGIIPLDTGENWRCLESQAWQRDVPSGSLGFVEIYDSRHAPLGWTQVDFGDSAWKNPEILRVPGRHFVSDIEPFPNLTLRDIPLLREEITYPKAILQVGETENALQTGEIADLFEQEKLGDLSHCRIAPDSLLATVKEISFSTQAGYSISLVLDFGSTVAGRVRFDVDAPEGAILDYTHSERLREDGRVLIHKGIPSFDVRQAHRVILRAGRQSWEAFEMAGFRYLQVTVRNCEQPLMIHSIAVNQSGYPVQERGHFECSDESLNRIWQVGRKTLSLCMHDAYVDCPSREQRQWMGDGYVNMLINFATFGDKKLAARLLRQIAQTQLPDGMTLMAAPGDFHRLRFVNIPDFSLYWIMAIEQYIRYSGEIGFAQELYFSVAKAIGWFEKYLNQDSLLEDVPHWVFVDWAELDKRGQVTALNAQFVATLQAASRLAGWANYPSDAGYFDSRASLVTAAINRHLWDEERGVYVDARGSRRVSQQSNAAAIAFGVAPEARWSRILDTILDEERLILTRAGEHQPPTKNFEEEKHVVLAQPFYMHHLHRALSKAGRQGALIANIRNRWGTLLEEGYSTFRETWQIDELTSLCHAFSATPTFDLSTEVLGVQVLETNVARLRVAPYPGDLAWARGTYPIPQGDVEVAWQVERGAFRLDLTIPQNTSAEVVLPGGRTALVGSGIHVFQSKGKKINDS